MPIPKFTIDQTTKFIELYKAHPCLWQSDTKAYRDKLLRKRAIDEIVAEMNIPDFRFIDCQIKIKNIRSHYLQELKKIYNYNMRGAKQGKVYKPTLSWFNLIDSFLWNYIVHQSPILLSLKKHKEGNHHSNNSQDIHMETEIKTEEVDVDDEVNSIQSWNVEDMNAEENDDFSVACNPMLYEIPIKEMEPPPLIRRTAQSGAQADVGRPSNSIIESDSRILTEAESEFDIFGKGVAAQLKNMPMIESVQLQLKIQQLITEHRLKLFSSQNASNILEHDKHNQDSD